MRVISILRKWSGSTLNVKYQGQGPWTWLGVKFKSPWCSTIDLRVLSWTWSCISKLVFKYHYQSNSLKWSVINVSSSFYSFVPDHGFQYWTQYEFLNQINQLLKDSILQISWSCKADWAKSRMYRLLKSNASQNYI